MRSGQVGETVRVSTGRCNPHRATQNQRGLHRSRLAPTPQCTCWARARRQRCSRLTSPMIRLLRGICQHRSPVMSRGGLCQAAPAAPSTPRPGPYGRMAWQPATAAVHSRFADKIPDVRLSVVVGSESTPDPGEDSPQTSWTERQQVPSGNGRYHRLDSSIVGTLGHIAFGPSVASPSPCDWRRPSLAVAGAGIVETRSVAENRLGSVKQE